MKSIEVHKYLAPTRDNSDSPWSLGIMNLTEAEAALIAAFANKVREADNVTSGTFAVRIERGTSYGLRETEYRREVDRVNGLTLKEEPKPPGNRFSGLDLPNADKS